MPSIFECEICGSKMDMPIHCGRPMQPQPTADNIEYLLCEGCGSEVELPKHHDRVMKLKT